jgi:ABC-type amino acid transport substrate-binding protein
MGPRAMRIRGRRAVAWLAACAGVLSAVALLAACGCAATSGSSSPAATAASSASGTVTAAEQAYLAKKGTLQVGAFNDYPPFGFVGADGEAAGISVDYWSLVAQRLGVSVAFTPVRFADQLDGLKQGKFDSLEGIFPLPERARWFAFSRPYFTIATRIYTEAGATDLASLAALKGAKGLKVAVVKGDSGQAIADKAGLKTLVVAGYPQAVKAVGSGRAQAMILDEMVAEYYIRQFKLGAKVKPAGAPVASGSMTMPVRKDDIVLRGILNKGAAMVSSTELNGIEEKWTGQ